MLVLTHQLIASRHVVDVSDVVAVELTVVAMTDVVPFVKQLSHVEHKFMVILFKETFLSFFYQN